MEHVYRVKTDNLICVIVDDTSALFKYGSGWFIFIDQIVSIDKFVNFFIFNAADIKLLHGKIVINDRVVAMDIPRGMGVPLSTVYTLKYDGLTMIDFPDPSISLSDADMEFALNCMTFTSFPDLFEYINKSKLLSLELLVSMFIRAKMMITNSPTNTIVFMDKNVHSMHVLYTKDLYRVIVGICKTQSRRSATAWEREQRKACVDPHVGRITYYEDRKEPIFISVVYEM